MRNKFWTSKEIEILREMINRGKKVEDAMKVLKSRTKVSITHKAQSIGLNFCGSPEIDLEAYKNIMKVVKG